MKSCNYIKQGNKQSVIGNFQTPFKSLLVILMILATFTTILIPAARAQQKTPASGGLQQNSRLRLQELVRVPMTISPWYKVPAANDRTTAVIATGKGQLVMFGSGPLAGQVSYRTGDGESWSGWKQLAPGRGEAGFEPITAASLGDGRMVVFIVTFEDHVASHGTLRCRYYDGTSWSDWQNLGGTFSQAPAVVVTDGPLLDEMLKAHPGALKDSVQAMPASSQQQTPSASPQPQVKADQPSGVILRERLKVLRRRPAGVEAPTQTPKQAPSPAAPTQTIKLPVRLNPSINAAQIPAGQVRPSPYAQAAIRKTIHLFATGRDGSLWHRYGGGKPGSWQPWQSLGGSNVSGIVAAASTPDKIDVVASSNSKLYYGALVPASPGFKLNGWQVLGNFDACATPVLTSLQTDQLDIFCLSRGDLNLYHRRRTGSSWSAWAVADNRSVPLAAIPLRADLLQVLVVKSDCQLHVLEWDGARYVISSVHLGGYLPTAQWAVSPDQTRFDLILSSADDYKNQSRLLWHKWWESRRSVVMPNSLPETGLQPRSFRVGGQGQPPALFGACNAGLIYNKDSGTCEVPPPPPPPPPPPKSSPSGSGSSGSSGSSSGSPSTLELCASQPIPDGYVKTDARVDSTRCGNPSPTSDIPNVNVLTRIVNAAQGTSLYVCADSPIPAGWAQVSGSYQHIDNRCGTSPYSSVYNMFAIRKN